MKKLMPIVFSIIILSACKKECINRLGEVNTGIKHKYCYYHNEPGQTFEPEVPFQNFFIQYDINNDEVNDFRFEAMFGSSPGGHISYFKIFPENSNTEFVVADADTVALKQFGEGKIIDKNCLWKSNVAYVTYSSSSGPNSSTHGVWEGQGYAGIRIKKVDGSYRYGWLYINLPDKVFKEYLFEKY